MQKTQELKNFTYFGISHKGNVRENNEDRFAHIESVNGSVFVLCDGMGGIKGGDVAAQITIDSIEKYVNEDWEDNPTALIKKAIEFANTEVYNYFNSYNTIRRPGTTLALVLIRNNKVYYAHVGDSRIYYQTGKKLFPITTDHSHVMNLVEKKIITEEEAREHPRRNEITKAIGIKDYVEPTICRKPLSPADFDNILLCSDGLSNELLNRQILKVLLNNKETEKKVELLLNEALESGGNDNITVQLIRFYNTGNKKSDKFTNSSPKTKNKFKIIFFVVFFIITSLVMLFYLLRSNIKIKDISKNKKYASSSLLIYTKNRKDTIINVFFSDNKNLEALLTSYNLTNEKVGHASSLVKNFGFVKYYIPVKTIYKHQVGKYIYSYPEINSKNIIDVIIVNNKNELYFKPSENIIVP